MVYQGSKKRLLPHILPILQLCIMDNNIETYIEPFVGGANVIAEVNCHTRIGSDINDELISLIVYMRDNPTIPIAPVECPFEHYDKVRSARNNKSGEFSKEYTALIGYFASYGGRYFQGGYGRDNKGGRCIYAERLKNARKQAPLLNGIELKCCSYEEYNPNDYSNCLFYCDIPYKGTKTYDGANSFDYENFYQWCRELGKNNYVFISEYSMPEDFKCVWTMDRKVKQNSQKPTGQVFTEKLFYCGRELNWLK